MHRKNCRLRYDRINIAVDAILEISAVRFWLRRNEDSDISVVAEPAAHGIEIRKIRPRTSRWIGNEHDFFRFYRKTVDPLRDNLPLRFQINNRKVGEISSIDGRANAS